MFKLEVNIFSQSCVCCCFCFELADISIFYLFYASLFVHTTRRFVYIPKNSNFHTFKNKNTQQFSKFNPKNFCFVFSKNKWRKYFMFIHFDSNHKDKYPTLRLMDVWIGIRPYDSVICYHNIHIIHIYRFKQKTKCNKNDPICLIKKLCIFNVWGK